MAPMAMAATRKASMRVMMSATPRSSRGTRGSRRIGIPGSFTGNGAVRMRQLVRAVSTTKLDTFGVQSWATTAKRYTTPAVLPPETQV